MPFNFLMMWGGGDEQVGQTARRLIGKTGDEETPETQRLMCKPSAGLYGAGCYNSTAVRRSDQQLSVGVFII